MADWDEDSPKLRDNLSRVLTAVRDSALRRDRPSIDQMRRWHAGSMAGLDVPDPRWVGAFRGEPGLETVRVRIGRHYGTPPAQVAGALAAFERTLVEVIAALDERYPDASALDTDGLEAVVEVAAWAHSEWVRIHPFANGNGRTARLWADAVVMRYGLPPVVRPRPRRDGTYAAAAEAAMRGDWRPTADVIHDMLRDEAPLSRRTQRAP